MFAVLDAEQIRAFTSHRLFGAETIADPRIDNVYAAILNSCSSICWR